ncbi:MAG: hypothetical protein KGJ80_16650 [Chloroflexota bacterium]|nr:hypothetical protein [Chloroflexota bacterium]
MPGDLKTPSKDGSPDALEVLRLTDISAIDQALEKVGLYGEVHLIVEKGRLRYIRTVRSEAVLAPHLTSSSETRGE